MSMTIEEAIKHFTQQVTDKSVLSIARGMDSPNVLGVVERVYEANELALEALKEKAERENPAPLTIEELRQMDGEPVWVDDRNYTSYSGYCVICAPKDTFSDHGDRYCIAEIPGCECGWHEFEKYGVNWIAYRHKPKEV